MHRMLRFAAVAALVVPVVAQAQVTEPRSLRFGVSAGLTMPMGDISDAYSSGFNVTGHVWYRPAMWTNLGFRGDVSYDRFDAKSSIATSDVSLSGNYSALGIVANGVYAFPQSDPSALLRPYALVGLGFYNTRSSITSRLGSVESTRDVSDSNLGLQGGVGVEFNLSGFSTFGEVKLVNVFGDGGSARWIPITFGIRF